MIYKNDCVEMVVDDYKILNVTDNFDGTCDVVIKMINEKSILVETLNGFTYKDDKWETSEVDSFIIAQLSE